MFSYTPHPPLKWTQRSVSDGLLTLRTALILDPWQKKKKKKLTSIFIAMLLKSQIYDVWKAFAKFHICIFYSTGDRLKALAAKQVKPRGWKEFKSI